VALCARFPRESAPHHCVRRSWIDVASHLGATIGTSEASSDATARAHHLLCATFGTSETR
ncbi:MAG: hypothetical protein PHU43_08995, partial [Candidatus Bipolaricaulis sp.]|nr:hypothetical protein [Candidatus Bipolaricaulis sp.]